MCVAKIETPPFDSPGSATEKDHRNIMHMSSFNWLIISVYIVRMRNVKLTQGRRHRMWTCVLRGLRIVDTTQK